MEWNRKPVFGIGINDVKEKTRGTKAYLVWKSMLSRCYSEYTLKSNPAYEGCSVCDDWLLFSNFKEWFDKNYIEGSQLDKDILVRGNKVYSPDTCCFVPQEINKFFRGHSSKKSISPGVHKQCRRYVSEFRSNGVKYIKSFDNIADAERFYAEHRSKRIAEIAESYFNNGSIPEKVYKAILSYAI